MGALTPLGNSVDESWQAALAGRSGIGRISHFDASDLPCQIAGEVKNFQPRDFMGGKIARRMSRAAQLAVAALRLAQRDAGLPDHVSDPENVGVSMGVAIGGFDVSSRALNTYWKRGWTKVSPFAVAATLPNMVTHHVSLEAQTFGPIVTQVAACA
ncbi:MAG TPA: beta-ketoacyl-[acyl-carrier-protein] synthase II, partial [Anaerolineae bacterium]|nr:beta-ketoacyl-[acyl-carrier-protein] synthase II [Anaerolineae bacterium]